MAITQLYQLGQGKKAAMSGPTVSLDFQSWCDWPINVMRGQQVGLPSTGNTGNVRRPKHFKCLLVPGSKEKLVSCAERAGQSTSETGVRQRYVDCLET